MRAWLYDTLVSSVELQSELGGAGGIVDRVLPRRSEFVVPKLRPFLIYGMGNSTNEALGDDTAGDAEAERQFFQIWVHDEGGSYVLIDQLVDKVKRTLRGKSSSANQILTIRYLETSAEFSNETYGTNFRYIRFQAIIAKGRQTP